jgi:hypothetical protein
VCDCTSVFLLFYILHAKVEAFVKIGISFCIRSSHFFKLPCLCCFHFSIVFRFVPAKILVQRWEQIKPHCETNLWVIIAITAGS